MLAMVIVVVTVSAALLVGAALGVFAKLPESIEGFMLAMAGGALIVAVMLELIQPSGEHLSTISVVLAVAMGAAAFTGLDWLQKRLLGASSGGGLLLAITLDGIPENLALGVALIGAGPTEVAALAGSIFLSNLPEAAGGAKSMLKNGRSKGGTVVLWMATAGLLAIAAIVGNLALSDVSEDVLALIRCFAAGAVTASLATEVFPTAYKKDHMGTGIAVTLGLLIAYALNALSGG